VGLVPFLQARYLQLLQPGDLSLREGLIAEIGQRRAAPERHRLVEQPDGLCCRSGAKCVTALEDELLEFGYVKLRRENPQRIAGTGSNETSRGEDSPQS
jgi:hypothetical protein